MLTTALPAVTFALHIGFLTFRLVDAIDILLASGLLYMVYTLMRGRIVERVVTGFLLLYLFYLTTKAAGMRLLTTMLGQFMELGVLSSIILFQQEIRKFLFLLGDPAVLERVPFYHYLPWNKQARRPLVDVTAILDAAKQLGGSNTGGLIVFSKEDNLKSYEESGDPIDALVSKRLLLAIFNKTSPLHDGAVIIYQRKVLAARCVLPVTEQVDIPAHYGLRHRAAIGMTEATDTLVLVISEETGQLAIALDGKLRNNLSLPEVRAAIFTFLFSK